MDIVIAGAGQVGFHIAKQLSEEKKNVALIEKDLDKAAFAQENLDCIVINGDATNIDILQQAGCDTAAIFIAVTNSDEINILSCLLTSSNFTTPKKVARLRSLEYAKPFALAKTTGIDFIINPEVEAAKSIVNSVNFGASSDIIIFEDTDIQMRGIYINKESIFLNKTITQIKQNIKKDFIITGIKREDGELVIPKGLTTVKDGDYIYIVSKKHVMEELLELLGKTKIRIKNIAIFGGSKIGIMAAKGLKGKRRNIKIIDKDYERCKEISKECPKAVVINGDASNAGIFEEEDIADFDVVITATGNEEINLLSALYAKNIGSKRSIALIDKANYAAMASRLDIDSVISPKLSAVSSILKYIRKGNVIGVYSIFGGEAEALELSISNESKFLNKAIKDLHLPKDTLIVAISRKNQTIIPDGNFTIENEDRVVMFAKKEDIPEIETMV
jgi:trk system potassium uptake protein TrkA